MPKDIRSIICIKYNMEVFSDLLDLFSMYTRPISHKCIMKWNKITHTVLFTNFFVAFSL